MTSQTWSLERELCKLAEETDVRSALVRLGLIQAEAGAYQFNEIYPWARSGSETYSYVFGVKQPDTPDRVFRIKACVAFSHANNLDEILGSWLRRRELIAAQGASTPKLYGFGSGVLLEEEIPLDMPTALAGRMKSPVLSGLVRTAAVLTRLRFSPVSAFSDVRSRGDDAVFVDFGSDLGEPGVASDPSELIFKQLVDQLQRWGGELSTTEQHHLREAFEARVSSIIH